MKTIIIAVAALLSGALLSAITPPGHGTGGASADASQAELERIVVALGRVQRDLRVLRAEYASLARQVSDLPSLAASEATAQATPARADAEDTTTTAQHVDSARPASEEELRAERRRYMEHADEVLAAQPRDSTWNAARELPARVQAVLTHGSRLGSITCGDTLCRVETQHATMDEYRAFMDDGFARMPRQDDTEVKLFWNGASAFLVDDESAGDGIHAVAYFARDDKTLP